MGAAPRIADGLLRFLAGRALLPHSHSADFYQRRTSRFL
jgi:hypothetical protein